MAVDAAALREGAQAGARGDEGGVGRGGERGWGGGGGGGGGGGERLEGAEGGGEPAGVVELEDGAVGVLHRRRRRWRRRWPYWGSDEVGFVWQKGRIWCAEDGNWVGPLL